MLGFKRKSKNKGSSRSTNNVSNRSMKKKRSNREVQNEVSRDQSTVATGPRGIHLFKKAPPASLAAFRGPCRYDWIDIETSAAIKVQAAYRRNRVMNHMEETGRTTAAVRNRARRNQAKRMTAEEAKNGMFSFFNCCGMDFGIGQEEPVDYFDMNRELQRARYEENFQSNNTHEFALVSKYQKKSPKALLLESYQADPILA